MFQVMVKHLWKEEPFSISSTNEPGFELVLLYLDYSGNLFRGLVELIETSSHIILTSDLLLTSFTRFSNWHLIGIYANLIG